MKQFETRYAVVNFTSPESIEAHAKKLEGMTFREVLDLGITPEGVEREYNSKRYKGGMGNLIEERYFGYKSNSDQRPDFPEAGVELKTTCFDVKKNGDLSAGERLVITMVPLDCEIEDDFYDSHAWEKCAKTLLIYYQRDRDIDSYDQRIRYVTLFTPPEADLKIIRDDYDKIATLVREGRAEELSEGMTNYLGACTKGATAEKSIVSQFYPPHTPAKRRAFCFKRQYMDYVLHAYIMGESSAADSIVKDASELEGKSFEDIVTERIKRHRGKTDRELCEMLGIPYTKNKAQWTKIVYALLDVRGSSAEEFEKANVSVRTVRVTRNAASKTSYGVRESLSLNTFRFKELLEEEWDDSPLHDYFDETRFFFVAFRETDDGLALDGARFWSMPTADIEGPLRECWEKTRETIRCGVSLEPRGKFIANNLPGMADNPVAHVRPHTSHAAYVLADGTVIGDPARDADELPDGRMMTKQSFWLNRDYIYRIVDF